MVPICGLDPDAASPSRLDYGKEGDLNRRYYRTGQLAKAARVSLRTLRYYDTVGLLSPSHRTEAGYRLYTDEDLLALQQILALKFMGFSLDEIKQLVRADPKAMPAVLARQKAMVRARRERLDVVLRALEETEALATAGRCDGPALIRVIQAIQMNDSKAWVKRYFTEEQLGKMEELSRSAYSEPARRALDERGAGWTEEDQKRAEAQWAQVAAEADRLAAAGADPASPEAQAVARLKHELIAAFTHSDPDIEAGLGRFWEQFRALPAEERPFDSSPFESTPEGTQLLDRALALYREKLPRAG